MLSISPRVGWLASVCLLAGCGGNAGRLQSALDRSNGVVTLPPGVTEISRELRVPPNAFDLEITGAPDSVLKAAPDFQGRALIVVPNATKINIHGFTIDGNRRQLSRPIDMPSAATTFLTQFQGSAIIVDESKDVTISNMRITEVYGFAVLASRTKKINIEKVTIQNTGGKNNRNRNNTSGGILLEESTDDFTVRDCVLANVLGNGIWSHSTYLSQRNYRGIIANNKFDTIGRDAIQVGHANRVRVEGNTGKRIGFPIEVVDVENQGTPVAIDTAGKVDESAYAKNQFEEVNGKCIDLDGFHDGEVSENTCVNRGAAADYPNGHYALVMNNSNRDMNSQLIVIRDNVFDGTKFGGIFIIGEGHRVTGNKLLNLNKWHCDNTPTQAACPQQPDDPDLMQAGIYLADRADRVAPARKNVIEGNVISGYRMSTRCILSNPKVSLASNTITGNKCSDQ